MEAAKIVNAEATNEQMRKCNAAAINNSWHFKTQIVIELFMQ